MRRRFKKIFAPNRRETNDQKPEVVKLHETTADVSSLTVEVEVHPLRNELLPHPIVTLKQMKDVSTSTSELTVFCDKEAQTDQDMDMYFIEEYDFAQAKGNRNRPFHNKSYSADRLHRLKTERVSIPDSDDEESPWTIPPGYFKSYSGPEISRILLTLPRAAGSYEDLQLKAEIILNEKLREYFPKFMMNKLVTAVDLGYREVQHQHTHLRCIKIWLKQKRRDTDKPQRNDIQKMIDGCPIDKVVGEGHLLGAEEVWLEYFQKRRQQGVIKSKAKEDYSFLTINPPMNIKAGESLGQFKNQYVLGTIGFILEHNSITGLLTAGQIAGCVGTRLVSPAKREGKLDDTRLVAMTTASIISEEVNCAFAKINGQIASSTSYIDGAKINGTIRAQVGDIVKYKGAGTGKVQLACVKMIDWRGEIDGMFWNNQIQLSMPALPGDAGAILVKAETNEVVGMLFANANKHALANHIDAILTALDADIH